MFFFILGLLWAISLFGTPLKPYVFKDDYHHLSNNYQYLKDCDSFSNTQVIEQFHLGNFKTPKLNHAFSTGITTCSYWLVVKVNNESRTFDRFLWSFYNNALSFSLYELQNNKLVFLQHSSMHQILEDRPYPVRSISFPFTLKYKQSKTLFVKVTPTVNKNIYFPTDITYIEDLLQYEIGFSFLIGKYFGVLLLTFIINFFLFLILKNRIYLYNLFYVFFVFLFQLSDFHFDSLQIPNSIFVYWSYINKDIFIAFAMFFYCLVFKLFTNFKLDFPRANKILTFLNLLQFTSIFLIAGLFFIPSKYDKTITIINVFCNAIIYLTVFYIFFGICFGIYRKKKFYILFGMSFFFLFYGYLSYIFNTINFIRLPIIPPGNIINGLVIEVVLLTIFFVYKFKIEKTESFEKIVYETKRNEELMQKMLTLEEKESERFSRNIHDVIGSEITGIRLQMQNFFLTHKIENNQQKELLDNFKNLYEKVRDFSYFLKTTENSESNFLEIIEDQIAFYDKNTQNIDFKLITNLNSSEKIPIIIQTQLIRIIKELITNVLKHSFATNVTLQIISQKNNLLVILEDNGIGFDVSLNYKTIGLESVKNRVTFINSDITIESSKNGTVIIIETPL